MVDKDELLDLAESRYGSDGPWVYFKTLAIMADNFSLKTPGRNIFIWSEFKGNFKIQSRRLRNILLFFDSNRRITCSFWMEDEIEIVGLNCPILIADLADEYTDKQMKKLSNNNNNCNNSNETIEKKKKKTAAEKKKEKEEQILKDAQGILDELNTRLKKGFTDIKPIVNILKMFKGKFTPRDCRAVMWLQITDEWFRSSKWCIPKGIFDKGKFESRLDNANQKIKELKNGNLSMNGGPKPLTMDDIMNKLK